MWDIEGACGRHRLQGFREGGWGFRDLEREVEG